MKQSFLFLFILFTCFSSSAQHTFSCFVKDETSLENLQSVTAAIPAIHKTVLSDSKGRISLTNLSAGSITISFSFVGYESLTLRFEIPQGDSITVIYLKKSEGKTEEEVIVSSSRTNSRIEDLPTKVEVLGSEEVGEENGIKPGNIASLLGDIAGIQIQQTSAATGNADARVQGLPGKYTQILRDGMPLFGGYSGSFSILQIPPLDLKQIELVKGASSTLYGGGAIAGMINLISKSPKLGKPEKAVTINQSTLKESNANVYFSNRNSKTGYTFFGGGTYQQAVDVNKDGFSDVPLTQQFFFRPRIFFYPNKRRTIVLGYNLVSEDRKGGDMQVLKNKQDSSHQFFIQNKSLRNTIDAEIETRLNDNDRLVVKGSASFFNRKIHTNVFGMDASQLAYFSEITYLKKLTKHSVVIGLNFNGENFTKKNPDSTRLPDYRYSTAGFFVQDDWKIVPKFTAQAGIRLDAHNTFGNFVLPRLSLLYKINSQFTTRLGGGLGYKIPSYFATDIDERSYPLIYPNTSIRAEKSGGMNWDITYKRMVNGWNITVNQMFYITEIQQPVINFSLPGQQGIYFSNAGKPLTTKGFETYIAVHKEEVELYFGYTYTVAKQLYNQTNPDVSLSARNKFASVIAYEFSEKFRAGIEASYTGKQHLDDGNTTSPYLFAAVMLRYNIKNIAFVLNCENLFDYRQTKQENIILGPGSNPVFKQIWAPLDGRVINLSINIKW